MCHHVFELNAEKQQLNIPTVDHIVFSALIMNFILPFDALAFQLTLTLFPLVTIKLANSTLR